MTTIALVHGAFHGAWCWDSLRPELEAGGFTVVAPDLPCEDPSAGCAVYADTVVAALAEADDDVVIVGHSLGGLTIPIVASVREVRRMVFLCAFLPQPGRPFTDQYGEEEGMFPDSPPETWPVSNPDGSMSWPPERVIPSLYPDCAPDVARWAADRLRIQALTPHAEPCPLQAWPAVPSSYVLARQDGAVGAEWARRTARERLGVTADEIDSGHSPFLSRPKELATLLADIARRTV
jgi:pimeloyl-ACP methyl ester carboxylesterase